MDCAGNEELAASASILPELVAGWRAGRLHRLLAGVRRGQQLVKLPIAVQAAQKGIGKQVGISAIVLLDGSLDHVERGIFLPL